MKNSNGDNDNNTTINKGVFLNKYLKYLQEGICPDMTFVQT